ncbi:MAG: thiamine diphosphokinase [Ignavibacteria bacterium]|nr:thiamine diphosphokinase [Ignavibacteria bacterium]
MKHALLICNGDLPDAAALRARGEGAAYVLCADGGANAARRVGMRPDAILGDFDSITPATRRHFEKLGVPLLHDPSQEITDFEKGLLHLKTLGFRHVVIAGITGLLLDHTFGNLSILLRHAREMDLVILDRHSRIDLITRPRRFASVAGQRVSIVPLPSASGVTYSGLKYPLRDAILAFGTREGTCNEARGKSFRVSLNSGVLLIFRSIVD